MSADGRPSGTVGFLLTDIEGSTRLWEEDRGKADRLIAEHDRAMSAAIVAHGGVVFSSAGDSVAAAFHTPAAAVLAALDAQRALQHVVPVRMAIHVGSAEERSGNYYGPTLNRCGRLRDLAHGGQVLLSEAARSVFADGADRATFRDLGTHHLRDFATPDRVYQLVHPDLPTEFPPLRALGRILHNLAYEPTAFIGRNDEIGLIDGLLAGRRHATLLGPGGSGKTRLALEVARRSLDRYGDGVWFVDLRETERPEDVAAVIAGVVGIAQAAERPMIDLVGEALAPRDVLLVLDNCEHVLEGAAAVADRLVHRDGSARLLATSRAPLGMPGEAVLPVGALPVPASPGLDDLLQSDAARLFVERARDAGRELEPARHPQALFEICRSLEGLPLALELAAARLRVFSPEEVAGRLNDHLRLLVAPHTTGDHRHDTMEATIAWSWTLLDHAEQTLFSRLSVFPASWSLRQAEQVCGFEPLAGAEISDVLEHLLDKSMVTVDDSDAPQTRYRILEPLRQFGARTLDPSASAVLRQRVIDYFVSGVLPGLDALLRSPDLPATMISDQANMVAAVEWALGDCRHEDAMHIVGAGLGHMFFLRSGGFDLISRWMDEASHHVEEIETQTYVQALISAGAVASAAWRNEAWRTLIERGLSVATDRHDREVLRVFGAVALNRTGAFDQANAEFEALIEESEDPGIRATALIGLAQYEGRERAWAFVEEALKQAPLEATEFIAGVGEYFVGEAVASAGRYGRAAHFAEQNVRHSRRMGFRVMEMHGLDLLATCQMHVGLLDEASATINDALDVSRSIIGPNAAEGSVLLTAGEIARQRGDLDQAMTFVEQALDVTGRHDHPAQGNWARIAEAIIHRDQGHFTEAGAILGEATTAARALGRRDFIPVIRAQEAALAVLKGRPESGIAGLCESLDLADEMDMASVLDALDTAAITFAEVGDRDAARQTAGATDSLRETLGIVPRPVEQAMRDAAFLRTGIAADTVRPESSTLNQAVGFVLERARLVTRS